MSNLSKLGLIASALLLGACTFQVQAGTNANGRTRNRQPAAPTRRATTTPRTTTPAPAPVNQPAPAVNVPRINGKNAFGNGEIGAFRGLAYVIPNSTQRMPDLSRMTPFAQLFTDSFIVQPQDFTAGFPGALMQDEWFAIRYDGRFNIQRDDTYTFKLTSDDGAILYIDGEKVIDNDGVHAAKEMTGTKALRAGQHVLRLDYFQGSRGLVALSLAIGNAMQDPRPLVGIR